MNEDNEMVPVSQLREAEAEIAELKQEAMNAAIQQNVNENGFRDVIGALRDRITGIQADAKQTHDVWQTHANQQSAEIAALRAQLREAEARAERAEAERDAFRQELQELFPVLASFQLDGIALEVRAILEKYPAHDAGKEER